MLPPSSHYQYFSHLYHGNTRVHWHDYQPMEDWDYPEYDLNRFTKLFSKSEYVKDQRVLDLGCHTGFMNYISLGLGAKSVCGLNARAEPLDVANYAYHELGQSNYNFVQGDIEDLSLLKQLCNDSDTVIFTQVLEHLRNPYSVLDTISNSAVKNLIFESTVFMGFDFPMLRYYKQSSHSDFAAYQDKNKFPIGSYPNPSWLEFVLYDMGWKIEYYDIERVFNKEWFGSPNQLIPPMLPNYAFILARKFTDDELKNDPTI